MTPHLFTLEHLDTPTGPMFVVTDGEQRLRALEWEDHEPRLRRLLRLHYGANGVHFRESSSASGVLQALRAYFEGDLDALDALTTATAGTPFQREVWEALRRIPVGQTVSYGRLAASIGRPKATRAVGLANGSNPIAIVVPCHRVIGADDSLTGYAGGVERKRWLLAHERRSDVGLGAQLAMDAMG